MHETMFANEILTSLKQKVKDPSTVRHITINVSLSSFTHVTPDNLRSAFDVLMQKESLKNIYLNIKRTCVIFRCKECNKAIEITQPVLSCPFCGSFDFDIERGKEFSIESIEVD